MEAGDCIGTVTYAWQIKKSTPRTKGAERENLISSLFSTLIEPEQYNRQYCMQRVMNNS